MNAFKSILALILLINTCYATKYLDPPSVSASASATDINNSTKLNLAHNYDPNFHVAFVLISFTTILFAIIVFGLSIAMWNMDPGRDSIIYRMTTQRIKKEQ